MIVGSTRSLRIAATALVVTGAALVGSASSAGASMGCGEYSFGFQGTRLINDGISNTAGPFTIDLPAGTYDVIMQSHDAHDEHPGQVEQTQEQWYFTLDSGYQSPASTDVADDSNEVVDEFDSQVVGTTTAITVHHLGQGGVNSVDPICVGFTTVVVPQPVILAPVLEEPVIEEPKIEAPEVDVVVEGVVEVAPVIELVPPAQIVRPKAVVEVKAAVEVAAPVEAQLALTGPSSAVVALLVTAFTLVALGVAQLVGERRRLS